MRKKQAVRKTKINIKIYSNETGNKNSSVSLMQTHTQRERTENGKQQQKYWWTCQCRSCAENRSSDCVKPSKKSSPLSRPRTKIQQIENQSTKTHSVPSYFGCCSFVVDSMLFASLPLACTICPSALLIAEIISVFSNQIEHIAQSIHSPPNIFLFAMG